jgi:hypothetical protein
MSQKVIAALIAVGGDAGVSKLCSCGSGCGGNALILSQKS